MSENIKNTTEMDAKTERILQKMEELLEESSAVPFSNKKMIDAEQMHEYIDSIRLNMPAEIKKAKDMARDKKNIIAEANKEAEEIVRQARLQAEQLVSEQEILKKAAEYAKAQAEKADAEAADIIAQAQAKDKAIREAMVANVNSALAEASEVLAKNLEAVNSTKDAIAKIGQAAE